MTVPCIFLIQAPFGRIIPAMITPMKADGSIDYEAAQRVAKQLVADGADGILVNGTTGESPVTHMDEKVDLVRAVKEVGRRAGDLRRGLK